MFRRFIQNHFKSNQRGLSLVEVLLSVSIMSFLSLTVMGYFIQSVDSSAEDSRRIVAIKLAEQKVLQVRNVLLNRFDTIRTLSILNPAEENDVLRFQSVDFASSTSESDDLTVLKSIAFDQLLPSTQNINGVDYHYAVDFYRGSQEQFDQAFETFTVGSTSQVSTDYLLKFRVTVYWGTSADNREWFANQSVSLDAYAVLRRY